MKIRCSRSSVLCINRDGGISKKNRVFVANIYD